MKIIIERDELTITFNLEPCRYAGLIRETFVSALVADGYDKELIDNVLNISEDVLKQTLLTEFEKWDEEEIAKSGQKVGDGVNNFNVPKDAPIVETKLSKKELHNKMLEDGNVLKNFDITARDSYNQWLIDKDKV